MARQTRKLAARTVETLSKAGRHSDGDGLYLTISSKGTKSWVFVYRHRTEKRVVGGRDVGRRVEMGIGGYPAVSLALARKKAAGLQSQLAAGSDPLAARRTAAAHIPTFKETADELVASLEAGWRNPKHRQQWRNTLATYCAPLHRKPVSEVTTADVLAVIKPIWTVKAETASRVRGRIENVLDAAKARGFRDGENPARWRGHLENLLPKRPKLQRGHHPAMPWTDLPDFMERLRSRSAISDRALEFVILTACRSGEVLRSVRDGELHGARWAEIDFETRVWTVPAARMKAGVEHRVPLTDRAIAILRKMEEIRTCEFIFPGQNGKAPLSEMALELVMRRMDAKPYTVPGFRSSFRDWVGEETSFPREITEAALAHTIGSKVERAYRRGDALERRRKLMEAWQAFLDRDVGSNVVSLNEPARRQA